MRIRGVFPRAGSMQFIGSDVVKAATQRECDASKYDPVVMGVDVARFGADASVIYVRRGIPAGKHDDQVDALGLIGQVLDRMNKGTAPKPEEPIRGLLGLTGLTMDEAWELARPKRPDWDARI